MCKGINKKKVCVGVRVFMVSSQAIAGESGVVVVVKAEVVKDM